MAGQSLFFSAFKDSLLFSVLCLCLTWERPGTGPVCQKEGGREGKKEWKKGGKEEGREGRREGGEEGRREERKGGPFFPDLPVGSHVWGFYFLLSFLKNMSIIVNDVVLFFLQIF